MKKRGFWVGKWNGFWGKLLENETVEDGTKRELFEEAGIQAVNLEKMGIVDFEFVGEWEILEVHIFVCTNFTGQPTESEEMKPEWFLVNEIPFDSMWNADRFWYPLLLEGKKFMGKFVLDNTTAILEKTLKEVQMV